MKLNEAALYDILSHIEEQVPFTDQYATVDLEAIGSECTPDELDYAFHVLKSDRYIDGSVTRPIIFKSTREQDLEKKSRYFVRSITLSGHRLLDNLRMEHGSRNDPFLRR